MHDYPPPLQELIAALKLLPSIGPRSAERLALFLLQSPASLNQRLAQAIQEAQAKIVACPECGHFAEVGHHCLICKDPSRSSQLWCIVAHSTEILQLEKSAFFRGKYHVLGGRLSPLDGIGPEQLRIEKLFERMEKVLPEEIILALGSDVEGETTALYLAPLLKKRGVRVSRLARGLPAGGGLEFADTVTLGYALEGRQEI